MSEIRASEHPIAAPPLRAAARLSRRVLLRRAGGGAVAFAVAALLGAGLGARDDDGVVPRGVAVAGVPLGGLAPEAALARLDDRARRYLARSLDVRAEDGRGGAARWQIAPADLGLALDTAAAVAAALAGRRPEPFPWSARDLPLPATLDDTRLVAALHAWAGAVTAPPVDARFRPEAGGGLAIAPDRAGRGIDAERTQAALLAHATALGAGPVALALVPVPADITAALLRTVEAQAVAVVREPPTLRLGDRRWPVAKEALITALRYRREGDRLVPALDPAPLRPLLAAIASAVARPGADARLALGADGRYTILPGEPGEALDEAATLEVLAAALAARGREAPVALAPQYPAVAAADLAPLYARLDAILNTPLVAAFEEYRRTLGRDDLFPLLVLAAAPEQPGGVAIGIDAARVRALAEAVAAALDREVRDAQFAWVDGAVREVVPSRDGRVVQLDPTADALAAAILAASGQATPIVAVTPPGVPSAARSAMVITDRLGAGRTDYGFSIPSRAWNVELAVQRLDGALIPPGATFSFNRQVGAQTVANGYREAYGIALVGGGGPGTGEVKTVSSVAGGICQVSTTLFQAAYRAGLPIEERNWHFYWIEGYGPPGSPTGLRGLDATVDDQSGLDFRFTNTTGGWLAVEAAADGARVRVALYGRDPGWTVRLDDPAITNGRPADPTPQIERTHDLPPGEELVVEHAVDGFDAANRVRVLDRDGGVIRDVTFTSNYYPSRNVTQVGVLAGEPPD